METPGSGSHCLFSSQPRLLHGHRRLMWNRKAHTETESLPRDTGSSLETALWVAQIRVLGSAALHHAKSARVPKSPSRAVQTDGDHRVNTSPEASPTSPRSGRQLPASKPQHQPRGKRNVYLRISFLHWLQSAQPFSSAGRPPPPCPCSPPPLTPQLQLRTHCKLCPASVQLRRLQL
ncbi:uncharacterized protein [Oryctolagus cuniculus]|uniref:uncharacterized protein n=1 Tax=Oryctolagus cuniculus TaxID=9986 RepID=UPI00222FF726|nr:uncharacterized protein LOC108177056 isoform X2 [Oryctolagus cuniculus]